MRVFRKRLKRFIQLIAFLAALAVLYVVLAPSDALGIIILAAIALGVAVLVGSFIKDEALPQPSANSMGRPTHNYYGSAAAPDNVFAVQVGHAWSHQRAGETETALQEFEAVIQQDSDNIDALYGIGLAQRATNHYQEAIVSFQRALVLIESGDLSGLKARQEDVAQRIRPNSPEEDRYMMLTRMLRQRINETERAKARQS